MVIVVVMVVMVMVVMVIVIVVMVIVVMVTVVMVVILSTHRCSVDAHFSIVTNSCIKRCRSFKAV